MNKSKTIASLLLAGLGASACAEEPMAPPAVPAAEPPPPPPPPPPAPRKDEVLAARLTPDAEFRKAQPTAGPEPDFKVPAVKRFKMKNGLQVILAESHDLPVLDFNLIIKAGGAANPKGLAGLADLTANMLDEATKTRGALQIADDVNQLGANLGTGAGWDISHVTLSSLSKNVDKALAIWADVLLNPTFDEKEFTRVRDNLVTGMQRRKDSPPAVGSLTFSRVLFGDDHPFAWPGNGVEESVKKITIADMKKLHDAYYRPNNAVLVVAGDVTEEALKAKLDGVLADWKAKPVKATRLPKPAAPDKTRVYLVDKAGAPQSSVRVGLIGIERTNPDYFGATVMNLVLGGSFMRLDMNLREGKGWTYGARSGFDMRRTPGPFSAGGEFKAEVPDNHTADAVKEILAEMKKMRDEDVTDDELRRAKDQITKAFPARFATRNSIAGQYADLAIFGLPDNYWETYVKKIEAVSKADVRKVAQKHLQMDKLAIVVVGDQKSNEKPLADFGAVEIRDLDGKPAVAATSATPTAKADKKKAN